MLTVSLLFIWTRQGQAKLLSRAPARPHFLLQLQRQPTSSHLNLPTEQCRTERFGFCGADPLAVQTAPSFFPLWKNCALSIENLVLTWSNRIGLTVSANQKTITPVKSAHLPNGLLLHQMRIIALPVANSTTGHHWYLLPGPNQD
jgi:hypothetical protein